MVIRFSLFSILLFFIPLYSHIHLDPCAYRDQARQWISAHIDSKSHPHSMSPEDLQRCANLFYFSYLRSLATLQAQERISKALEYFWHGWQNIAQTRMNPSRKLPFAADYEIQKKIYEEFIAAQAHHRDAGQSYAHIAELVVNTNVMAPASKEAIVHMRAQARQEMIQAFSDIKKTLGNLIDFASAHLRSDWIPWDDEGEMNRFAVIDMLCDYLPSLALKSYIEMEKINTQATDQTWQILMTMNFVNQQIWHAVETARASYYLAYYQELYFYMQSINLPKKYFACMVNQNGIISTDQKAVMLAKVG